MQLTTSCRYSSATSLTDANECSNCPAGYFCPAGSTSGSANLCADGYWSSGSAGTCTQQCDPGYYCPPPATSARGSQCGEGNYCPAGSVAPSPIEEGYYGVGGTVTTRSAQAICPKGYYCSGGAKLICPAGSYGGSEGLSGSLRFETCQRLYVGRTAPVCCDGLTS